jgi:hypothetical protein
MNRALLAIRNGLVGAMGIALAGGILASALYTLALAFG